MEVDLHIHHRITATTSTGMEITDEWFQTFSEYWTLLPGLRQLSFFGNPFRFCLPACLHLPACLNACLSVGPSVRPSVRLSVCLPVCLTPSISFLNSAGARGQHRCTPGSVCGPRSTTGRENRVMVLLVRYNTVLRVVVDVVQVYTSVTCYDLSNKM